jgi:hypothetical protein
VLHAWLAWRRSPEAADDKDLRPLLIWEQVLFAIRADLGHNNTGLHRRDLLRLYVNDMDESLAGLKTPTMGGSVEAESSCRLFCTPS